MKLGKYLLVAILCLLLGGAFYLGRGDQAEQEAAELLRDRQAQPEPESKKPPESTPKKNKPTPGDFLVDIERGGVWHIGKRGTDLELMLPFPPRHIPQPDMELEPTGTNPGFLGADACQSCHDQRHASFTETAHYRTSAYASTDSIAGSFESGKNKLRTGSQSVSFEMLDRDGRLFQSVSFFGWKCDIPMDLVTGSSKLGQSYLFWHEDALFQSHVSYVRGVDDWINSPGFQDGRPIYSRPVTARCLECHSTWADFRKAPNHFTPQSVIAGISCERCHGPGRDHVAYHQENPTEKVAKHIVHPESLPRQQQLELCGQCHFGIPGLKGAPYQFRPGDRLSDHYQPPSKDVAGGVHSSNQLARLSISPCFTQTDMTCINCHNPHQSERGNRKLFSQRCLNCHETVDCGMEATLKDRLADNCIDCHMPAGATNAMFMDTSQGRVFPPLRDHHIRVDRTATEIYLKSIEQ